MAIAHCGRRLDLLRRILGCLPANSGVALLCQFEREPETEENVAALLGRAARLEVREAEHGMRIEPDHVYVIRASMELSLRESRLHLLESGADASARHGAADRLFVSLATAQGRRAVSVLLPGADIHEGQRAIREVGGLNFEIAGAERPDSPHVDFCLGPEEIAAALSSLSSGSARDVETHAPTANEAPFVDRDALRALRYRIVPEWIAQRQTDLRIWVPGCGTGEEVYALAIELREALHAHGSAAACRVFGTDRTDVYVRRARNGTYGAEALSDLEPAHLRAYFKRMPGGFEIAEAIRAQCVYAVHDVRTDPPFSQLHLVRCGNLDAVRGTLSAEDAFSLLHYALRPGGVLLLGAHQEAQPSPDLFAQVADAPGLYRRVARSGSSRKASRYRFPILPLDRAPAVARRSAIQAPSSAPRLLHGGVAGAVIDERAEILELCGDTSPYLDPPGARSTLNLLGRARPELLLAVADAIDAALTGGGESATQAPLEGRTVHIRIHPVAAARANGPARFFVQFHAEPSEEAGERSARAKPVEASMRRSRPARSARHLDALRAQIRELAQRFDRTREDLLAAHAEIQSGNEELQTLNEELQASREELHATNQQLWAANKAISQRVDELEHMTAELSQILSTVQIPIVMLSKQLRIRRFTPAARSIFRLMPGDIGRPFGHVRSDLELDDLEERLAAVAASGAPHTQDVRDRAGQSYTLWIHPYRTRAGSVDGLVLVLVDIHHVAAARDLAEAILATAPCPMLVLDADLAIRTANPAFLRTFRLAEDALKGHPLWELGGADWQIPELRRLLSELIENDSKFDGVELDHAFSALGTRTLRLSGERIDAPFAPEKLVLATIEDITERRAAERRLVQADARKDEFIAMLGHELRNPLAPMVYALELLRQGAGERSAPLAILERQLRHMTRLVDDLLDASRITRGQVEIRTQRIDLREAIASSVEAARAGTEARRQSFEVLLPERAIWVDADPTRIEQIVGNLVRNAVKYTGERGTITVTAECTQSEALLRVRDTGQGIDPDLLPWIFDVFVQGETELDRSDGGLGIGLSVARTLVTLHGGTIEARSAGKGAGSEFSVRLPLARAHVPSGDEATRRAPDDGAPESRPARVLVIEDNADAAEALGVLLAEWGHEVRSANGGPEALEIVERFHPDVVLLDIGLPGMSGYELAGLLRERIPGTVRIVAMSGYGQAEDLRRSAQAGLGLHLVKPVHPEALRAALQREPV